MPQEAIYNVFLSHNSDDKPAVEAIASRLLEANIQPWLDTWNLVPGEPWQPAIEAALEQCATCAVFIGPNGHGPWQNEEMRAAINRRVSDRKFRVIPVLLPGAQRGRSSELPGFLRATTWVEFRERTDDDAVFHRLVCGIQGVAPGPQPTDALKEGDCPFRGLEVFDVEHRPVFFGREALTDWLLDAIDPRRRGQLPRRFLGIIGASGSGKSSLARAGLLASVNAGALRGSDRWPIATCRPGSDPLESLAITLCGVDDSDDVASADAVFVNRLSNELLVNPATFHRTVELKLRSTEDCRMVLLVDQFEELFTVCDDESKRAAFIENLLYPLLQPESRAIVVITLRVDFCGHCSRYEPLAAALSDNQLLVSAMSDLELRSAVAGPARVAGCDLEPGLIERIIDDARDQSGTLPLMQYALLELWQRRRGRELTHASYEAIGGVTGALQRRAEDTFRQFDQRQQDVCRRVMMRLVELSGEAEHTKCETTLEELLPERNEERDMTMSVIDSLASRETRLITVGSAPGKDTTVEVAHEALIRNWERLREWIKQDQEFLLFRQRLRNAVGQWQRTRRDEGALLRGVALSEARGWLDERLGELTNDEVSFIRTSIANQRDAQVEAERRRRRFTLVACGALSATIVLLFVALLAWNFRKDKLLAESRAASEAREARRALAWRYALNAEAVLDSFPQRGLLLAADAINTARGVDVDDTRLPAAEDALRRALANASGLVLSGHEQAISQVAVSVDKRWVITATGVNRGNAESRRGAVRLWNVAGDRLMQPVLLEDARRPLALSDDGQWLATSRVDGRVMLWTMTTVDESIDAITLPGFEGTVNSMQFSRDGRWLAIGSDGGARLWDLAAERRSGDPLKLQGGGACFAFSPDNRWLATGSNVFADGFAIGDERVWLWDLTSPDPTSVPRILAGHSRVVTQLAFSDDGKWLATGCDSEQTRIPADRSVRLWNLNSRDLENSPLVLEASIVRQIEISPDSRWLVTGSNTWDLTLPDPSARRFELAVDAGSATCIGPRIRRGDRDTQWLATVAESPVLLDLNGDMQTPLSLSALRTDTMNESLLAIDSRHHRLTTTSNETSNAYVWSLTEPDPTTSPRILRGHEQPITCLAFSADGNWVVTGSEDKTARLWSLIPAGPAADPLIVRADHFLFSPDSQWFVADPYGGKTVTVWNLKDPLAGYTNPFVLRHDNDSPIYEIAISPDGRWLVTTDYQNMSMLWSLTAQDISATGRPLPGHTGAIPAVAISSDSRRLATGSFDNTVRLWDLSHADPANTSILLRGHGESVFEVAFSPDGRWLLSIDSEGGTRLWDIHAEDPSGTVRTLPGKFDSRLFSYSPDSHWLATGSSTTVHLWDLTAPNPASTSIRLEGHRENVRELQICPDGNFLATGDGDGTVRLWDLKPDPSVTPVVLTGHNEALSTMAISSDSHWLVTGSYDDTARVWNLSNPAAAPAILDQHRSSVSSARFSPDNRWLVTGTSSGSIALRNGGMPALLWEVTETGPANVPVVLPFEGDAGNITFSPDGRWLAIRDYDNINTTTTLFRMNLDELLELAARTAGRNLTQDEWRLYFPERKYVSIFPDLPGTHDSEEDEEVAIE